MSRKIIIILLGFTVFLSEKACFAASYDIRFGIMVKQMNGFMRVTEETTVIPFYTWDTGFRYGFTISNDSDETYRSYAVHYFPARPAKVRGPFENPDTAMATRGLKTKEEEIFDRDAFVELGFEQGDPLGTYKVEIYINGRMVKSISYEVVNPEEYKRRKHSQ